MPSIEYAQWVIITVLSLAIVKALYRGNWTPIEKMIFGTVAGSVFFFLTGAFWLTTGKRFDEIAYAYEAILCPFFSISRCELSLAERELQQQAKLERERFEQKREEKARIEQEREELARLVREREGRGRLERNREEQAGLERERKEPVKLERERDELARLEAERGAHSGLERDREEQPGLERERKERAKGERGERGRLQREREQQAKLEREREGEERRSHHFAAMAVGNTGNRFFAVTVRDMSSDAAAQAEAMARCNQEVSNCRIQATFSGAGQCGYAAIAKANVWLFGRPIGKPDVHTGPTATEAIEKCQTAFRSCYIFHTSCNSP